MVLGNAAEWIMFKGSVIAFIVSLGLAGGAQAGCLAGAAAGGVVGHMAGHHGLIGAAVGCAVGHHHAKVKQANQANQTQGDQSTTH